MRAVLTQQQSVFVVDDDADARNSVKALVRSMGIDVVTYSSAEEFLEELNPDAGGCLVTDLRMMGMSGIELQEVLAQKGVTLPVILITAYAETPLTVQAVRQGAVTVLEKPCRDYELVDAIRSALEIDSKTREKTTALRQFQERLNTLSEQENTVLNLMMEGVANKVIARRLDVSVRTVENRRQRIFDKTGTLSLAELIRQVVECRHCESRVV